MPRYHLSLTPIDNGLYSAMLMDTAMRWPIGFRTCRRTRIEGRAAIVGSSTDGLPGWELTVRPTSDGMFQADATDGRDWEIRFPECVLEQDGAGKRIDGWAEEAEIIEEKKGEAA
ncbi:hypothetical protein AA0472_1494 [Acetobacter estunensis NRIC 0472]|uniref:Uncharacterized protein n=1 Tax=Acetobacter estunensis TaxID=104097 RepID=A0A967B6G5_9PROT|nr:hypothetical protein [Acetobacter estunensis]NHO53081.1 hypothetical protein [Acetobacter estunensis]GBQ24653.1 hypothetical protein AA0472_1494 [Acetobacter estunensis NRIC 0472]